MSAMSDLTDALTVGTHDEAAAVLVALKQAYYDRAHEAGEAARVGELRRPLIESVFAASDDVDAACEDFRRRFYPRSGRVICALGSVMAVSPSGGRTRTVFDSEG